MLVNAPCPGEHFAAFPFASDNLLRFRRVSPILFRLFALASIISPRTLTIGRDASAYTRYLGIASKGLARMHKFVRTALPAFDEHGFRLPDATRSHSVCPVVRLLSPDTTNKKLGKSLTAQIGKWSLSEHVQQNTVAGRQVI